jgi:hypothetical protein
MGAAMSRSEGKRKPAFNKRLKKYRVTILPTMSSIELEAESPEEAEELADHYWDTGWDGEFVTRVEEISRTGTGGSSGGR